MEPRIEDKYRTEDVKLLRDDTFDFSRLLIVPEVLQGLKKAGFVRPSPIQFDAIPLGRCGFDLVIQSKSGTGKTCVFSVIALERVNAGSSSTQVLVLVPTREIALQVADVVCMLGCAMSKLRCHAFIGGIHVSKDRVVAKGCQVAIGTPGRIKQLITEGVLKTDAIRLFVLDEADKLLEESFQRDINWIFHKLPSSKQMLAVSATYTEELACLLTKYMQSPNFVRLNSSNPVLLGVKQFYRITKCHPMPIKSFENKVPSILSILSSVTFGQCIIFSNFHMRAQALCDRLNSSGWPASYICGQKTQAERSLAIDNMRKFKCRVLVSTDLLARGIDLENINLVINIDVPQDLETYLHRIGRGGRFGSLALAITIASAGEEVKLLNKIQAEGRLKIAKLPEHPGNNLWKMEISQESIVGDCSSKDNEPITSVIPAKNKGLKPMPPCDTATAQGKLEEATNMKCPEGRPFGAIKLEELKKTKYETLEREGLLKKAQTASNGNANHSAAERVDGPTESSDEAELTEDLSDAMRSLLMEHADQRAHEHVPTYDEDVSDDLEAFLKRYEGAESFALCDVKNICESGTCTSGEDGETSLYATARQILSIVHNKFIKQLAGRDLETMNKTVISECMTLLPSSEHRIRNVNESRNENHTVDHPSELQSHSFPSKDLPLDCRSGQQLVIQENKESMAVEDFETTVNDVPCSPNEREGYKSLGRFTQSSQDWSQFYDSKSQFCNSNGNSFDLSAMVSLDAWYGHIKRLKYHVWFSEYMKEMCRSDDLQPWRN